MSQGFIWTPEEITALHEMREQGLSQRQCAARLPGRSYDAVRSRLKVERQEADPDFDPGALSEARELGAGRFRDRDYVDACLRHGGFVALQFQPRRLLRIAA